MSWLGVMADAVVHCGGKASAALSLVLRRGKPYLPECLPWRAILSTWSNLSRQHDASIFLTHLLEYANPRALVGQWQARLYNPDLVTDSGPLRMPILLDVRGPRLQDAVTHWHLQHTRHALASHKGVVLLQLKRYDSAEGASRKNFRVVSVRPGDIIQLPVFCAEQGVETYQVSFAVIFAIFHLVESLEAGHYQAALSVPTHPPVDSTRSCSDTAWAYHICNDRHKPRRAKPADAAMIDCNTYLIGLLRLPEQHQ